MLKNRFIAGRLLAEKLKEFKGKENVILAVPRGGIPVAYDIAKDLNLSVEIVLTKKIGHPRNKEYAIGAASLTDYFVNPHPEVTDAYVQSELRSIRKRLVEIQQKFKINEVPVNFANQTIIVVDDGMATGNTLLSTISIIKKSNPKQIIVAVPIASKEAVKMIAQKADRVITLSMPDPFYGVGAFYENFTEVNDDEVLSYIDKIHQLKSFAEA
jgi:putative phosphoribosyl transferase